MKGPQRPQSRIPDCSVDSDVSPGRHCRANHLVHAAGDTRPARRSPSASGLRPVHPAPLPPLSRPRPAPRPARSRFRPVQSAPAPSKARAMQAASRPSSSFAFWARPKTRPLPRLATASPTLTATSEPTATETLAPIEPTATAEPTQPVETIEVPTATPEPSETPAIEVPTELAPDASPTVPESTNP